MKTKWCCADPMKDAHDPPGSVDISLRTTELVNELKTISLNYIRTVYHKHAIYFSLKIV